MRQSKKGSKRKSLPKLKKEAQKLFNAQMRVKFDYCISCGKRGVELQAGHFYAVGGYDGLRYEEDNCWPECIKCNCFDESHLIGYAENLRELIGEERFEILKQKAKEYKKNGHKWSRTELEEKIIYYTEKVKQLKQEI